MSHISALHAQSSLINPLPSVAAPKAATTASTSSTGTSTASSTSQSSVDSLGNTFLSLLVQELQNQDPTAPMDSTQMVGQMISLNQLDQVASINQLLTNQFGSTSTTAGTGTATSGTAGTGTATSGTAAGQVRAAGPSEQARTADVQAALQALTSASSLAANQTTAGLPSF